MSEQDKSQEQAGMDTLSNTILMAFNLGVQFNQQTQGTKSVTEVTGEIGHNIYSNLKQAYGEQMEDDFLRANTEYLLNGKTGSRRQRKGQGCGYPGFSRVHGQGENY